MNGYISELAAIFVRFVPDVGKQRVFITVRINHIVPFFGIIRYDENWDDDIIFYKGQDMYDVAYNLVNECYDLEKMLGNLASYFDYNAFARDLSFDGYSETERGVIEIR